MSASTAQLKQIQQLLKQGDPIGAERLCRRLFEAGEEHPLVLSFLASRALEAGDWERAIPLSRLAAERFPRDATLCRNLGIAYRRAGRLAEAEQAFRGGVENQPDGGAGYLYLGESLLQAGNRAGAERCFEKGFLLSPELRDLANEPGHSPLQELVSIAERQLKARLRRDLEAAAAEIDRVGERLPPRLWEFVEYSCGKRPIAYADSRQRPSFQYYPGLRTARWWDPRQFDWVPRLEAHAAAIRAELEGVISRTADLAPYVTEIHPQAPRDWQQLLHSDAWSSYHLLKGGEPVDDHCRACPETTAVLNRLPLARAQGHAPEAFFSILKSGTHIPPHYGLANTKLVVHLPLIVPPDCAIRVGGESRQWHPGRCLIFDDSFLHEAWNRSNQLRVVLISEIWNPSLSVAEQAALAAMIKREDDWHRECRSFDASTA